MSLIDLLELHAAGAEITGHADAWLALGKQPRVRNDRMNLTERVRDLHRNLGRRVVPADVCPPTLVASPLPSPTPPQPEPTMPETPDLLATLNATLAKRGKGAATALAMTLGIETCSISYWRKSGKVPEARRSAVQAWIDNPTVTAVRVEKAKTPPASKPKAKVAPAKPTKIAPATPIVPAHHLRTVCDLCSALAIEPQEVWLQEGPTMVKARAIVLPSLSA